MQPSSLINLPGGGVLGHTLAGVVYHNTFDSELAVFEFDRVLELDPELKTDAAEASLDVLAPIRP